MPTWNTPEARDRVIRTLIGEAAAGDQGSLISVAHVLKNRADTGLYGDKNVSGAAMAPKQFSMWNEGMRSSGKTISPNDPRYIQAGQIADAVFSGQVPDNTGGADHYYAPSGMPGGHAPSWAIGQTPTATIGGQHFYKLGLSASDAIGNQGHTSAGAIGDPPASPLAPLGPAGGAQAAGAVGRALADAHKLLGKNEVPDHDMLADYLKTGGQNLDPHQSAWCAAFVSASLQREGLPVPGKIVKDSQFAGGANARDYLTYGQGVTDPAQVQAGDILVAKDGSHVGFAEGPVRQGPNGPEVQLLAGNEKDASGKYAPGSWTNPQTGQTAGRSQVGEVAERWVPLADFTVRRAPTGAPDTGPASSAIPAAAAQPVSAAAPGSSGGNFAVPPGGGSAGFVGPGSDKYSVVQGMTTGTSRNPQLTTAANWGNLFGGGTPSAPPSAPAAPSPPTTQPAPAAAFDPKNPPLPPERPPAPIDKNNPLPWQAPPDAGPASSTAPAAAASIPAPAPIAASVASPAPAPVPWPSDAPSSGVGASATAHVPNWGPWHFGGSPSGPIIEHPWDRPIDAPPPPQARPDAPPPTPPAAHLWDAPMSMNQPANLPGSMFASAQNLLKLLFPSQTG